MNVRVIKHIAAASPTLYIKPATELQERVQACGKPYTTTLKACNEVNERITIDANPSLIGSVKQQALELANK